MVRLAILACCLAAPALAQGTDGTPAERDLMVLAELLPGTWDNGEQASFEPRLKTPLAARHAQQEMRVTQTATALHSATLTATGARMQTWSLSVAGDAVRMTRDQGCALLWRREAGQFRGTSENCTKAQAAESWLLSPDRLWISIKDEVPTKYMRATTYQCYVDMPGASGGRAIPFKRIDGLTVTDQGKVTWFDTPETPSRRLGLQLRNVDWPFNNAPGIFTRDSLTIYLVEQGPSGEPKSLLYGWTIAGAPRIGLNGIWALANCFRESMKTARPEF
jgi:hypothetical protein